MCDFCGDPQPRWSFPCRDFALHVATEGPEGPEGVSERRMEGAWLACDPCRPLIEAQDWPGVAYRLGQHSEPEERDLDRATLQSLGEAMAVMWTRFHANRTGPPTPWRG
jgi:hypothetical protein